MFDDNLLKIRLSRKKDLGFFLDPILVSANERQSLLKISPQTITRIDLETYLQHVPIISSDFVISFMCLHWINDVEEFLKGIYDKLNITGAFQGCFVGGNSLNDLRFFFMNTELEVFGKVYPRFSPLIDEISLINLLGKAGFSDIVIDRETYEFEYTKFDDFIKDLRISGQTNALNQGRAFFPRKLYLELKNNFEKKQIPINFDIIYWSCFKK